VIEGRSEAAERHFGRAAEIDTRLGAPLLLARTKARWASALIDRGRPQDRDRAETMLEGAQEAAGRLGAEGIAIEIAQSRAAMAAIGG
jgi:hypothetical protein